MTSESSPAIQASQDERIPIGLDPNDSPTSVSRKTATSVLRPALHGLVDVLQNNTGLLLVAAAQAFFSMMNVSVKKLNNLDPPVSAIQLVAVRMIITYICCMTYMIIMRVPEPLLGPKGVRFLLLFRGFSGFFSLFGLYYSLQYLSLSDATVLTFLSPTTTAMAGALILKEPFSMKQALAGLLSLVGVVLIARPASIFGDADGDDSVGDLIQIYADDVTPSERTLAVGVALFGVLGSTGAYTSLRAIGKRAHPLHTLTWFSSQCVIVSSMGMAIMKIPLILPTEVEWLCLFVMIGVFGFVGQVLLTLGLQRETAGRGTMALYTQIVFATILEMIFLDTVPSFLSAVGTSIIMTSAIYIALTKTRRQAAIALPESEEEVGEERDEIV